MALLVLVGLSAVAVRILAARGDLWIDEIFSLVAALDATGPGQILSGIHHDNNHWLNTLWLRLVGVTDHLVLYRAFAIATGVGTLVVVTLHGLAKGIRPALTALVLFGFASFLVLMDSEARGYGPAIFFGVCAYVSLERHLTRGDRWSGAAFAAAATLGILSQLTFIWIYAGLVLWSVAIRLWPGATSRPRTGRHALGFAALHIVPGSVLGLLLMFDVRHWEVGGSPPYPLARALEDLVRYTAGAHGPGWLVGALGIGLLGLVTSEVLRHFRSRDRRWLFFASAIFIGPISLMVAMSLGFFYPRYVVVSLPFALLLLADALDRLADRGAWGTLGWAVLLALFVAGNVGHLFGLLRDGRGHYESAVTHVVSGPGDAPIRVALEGASAQEPVLGFYAQRVPGGERIRYHPVQGWDAGPADWVLVQRFERRPPGPADRITVRDHAFDFQERFPHWGPSGWTWDLYRLAQEPARSPP